MTPTKREVWTVKIGQAVYVQAVSDFSEKDEMRYRSRIAELSEEKIFLEVPFDEERRILKIFATHETLTGFYVSDDGIRNYFETKVMGYKRQGFHLLIVQRPAKNEIRRFQRRNFLRLKMEIDLAICKGSYRQVVSTFDIGGGGVSFICSVSDPIEMGDALTCWMPLYQKNNTIDFVFFAGTVMRVRDIEGLKHVLSVQFTYISNEDQQKIVRYTIDRQLAKRK